MAYSGVSSEMTTFMLLMYVQIHVLKRRVCFWHGFLSRCVLHFLITQVPATATFLEAISWQWEDSCGGIHENELVAELGPGEKQTWLYSSRYKGGLLIGNQLAEVNCVQQQCMAQSEKKLGARLNKEG